MEHNLGQKDDFKKSKQKMVGLSTIQEINELDFLAKYFKGKFNHKDWQERIEKKILKEKFDDLTKRYNIIVEQKNIIVEKKR